MDRFYGMLNHASDGIFVYADGTVAYVNPALASLLGFGPGALPTLAGMWRVLIHPEDREAALARLRAMARGQGESDRGIFRIVRLGDRRERYVEVALTRIPGPDVWVIGVVRDVTAQVEHEKARQRNNRLLAGLARAAEPLITEPDVHRALDALREATGVDRATVFIVEEGGEGQRAFIPRAVADADKSTRPTMDAASRTSGDTGQWLDLLASDGPVCCATGDLPDELGKPLSAVGVQGVMAVPLVHDRQIFGMIRLDTFSDRAIPQVNDRLCEMTGYDRETLVGHDIRLLYATEEDYACVGDTVCAQIAAQDTGVVETRWQRRDGAVIDVLLGAAPLNPHNVTAGVTFAALDITARKREETELRSKPAEAEARLGAEAT
ncbi:MAG: PAS domain S-box protein [Anaerolineae bacterium]